MRFPSLGLSNSTQNFLSLEFPHKVPTPDIKVTLSPKRYRTSHCIVYTTPIQKNANEPNPGRVIQEKKRVVQNHTK